MDTVGTQFIFIERNVLQRLLLTILLEEKKNLAGTNITKLIS